MIRPIPAQADDSLNKNSVAEQVMSKLQERLNLAED
jgi:hypothetical protein